MPLPHETFSRRFGRFRIRDYEISDARLARLHSIMQCFLVLDARYDMCWQSIEYRALSELFDVVPKGEMAPEYEIIVHESDGVVHDVEARRI